VQCGMCTCVTWSCPYAGMGRRRSRNSIRVTVCVRLLSDTWLLSVTLPVHSSFPVCTHFSSTHTVLSCIVHALRPHRAALPGVAFFGSLMHTRSPVVVLTFTASGAHEPLIMPLSHAIPRSLIPRGPWIAKCSHATPVAVPWLHVPRAGGVPVFTYAFTPMHSHYAFTLRIHTTGSVAAAVSLLAVSVPSFAPSTHLLFRYALYCTYAMRSDQ